MLNIHRSPNSRGVVPKTFRRKWNKIAAKLWDNELDLQAAKDHAIKALAEGEDVAKVRACVVTFA